MDAGFSLEIENVTQYRRWVFVLAQELPSTDAVGVGFGAWKRAVLGSGDTLGAYWTLQVLAQLKETTRPRGTAFADTPLATGWQYDGAVLNAAKHTAGETSITVHNTASGPAIITPWSDGSALLPGKMLAPQMTLAWEPGTDLFFYASTPVENETQPINLESKVHTESIKSVTGPIHAQILQDGGTIQWRIR